MKPSQNTRTGAQKFPLGEYFYHKPILNPSSAPCVTRPNSCRDISQDYFDAESKREFVTEAAVAGTLIIMAIMPIMAGVFAVAHLLSVLPLFLPRQKRDSRTKPNRPKDCAPGRFCAESFLDGRSAHRRCGEKTQTPHHD